MGELMRTGRAIVLVLAASVLLILGAFAMSLGFLIRMARLFWADRSHTVDTVLGRPFPWDAIANAGTVAFIPPESSARDN